MRWIKRKDKNFIFLKIVASICLLIGGGIFFVAKYIWHYDAWSDLYLYLFNFCTTCGSCLLLVSLSDLWDLIKKGRTPVRRDERTKMIFDKSARNAFFAMIIALPFLATFFTASEIMDINLFAAILIWGCLLVFLASIAYYSR